MTGLKGADTWAGRPMTAPGSETDSEQRAGTSTNIRPGQHPGAALRPGGAPREAWTTRLEREDRSLGIEVENRRLKKELQGMQEQAKAMHARLARTEEAAKRAMLPPQTAPGARVGGTGVNNPARLFAAEQRAQELEEQVRLLSRQLQTEQERTAHFKSLARDLKARLAEYLKVTRNKKPGSKAGGKAQGENLVELGRRAAVQQHEIDCLRRDNEQLKKGLLPSSEASVRPSSMVEQQMRNLQQQVHVLQAMNAELTAQRVAGRMNAAAGAHEWVVELVMYCGREFVVDANTQTVYEASLLTGTAFAVPVGRRVMGEIELMQGDHDFFVTLDAHLRSHERRLRESFAELDVHNSGALDQKDVERLLQGLMPGTTRAAVAYFQAMLEIEVTGKVTYEELRHVIREGLSAGAGIRAKNNMELNQVLDTLASSMRADPTGTQVHFMEADSTRAGALPLTTLPVFLKKMVPGMNKRAQRLVTALAAAADVHHSGTIQLGELKKVLRLSTPTVRAASASSAAHSWVLEEVDFGGQTFLVDPHNGYVYDDCDHSGFVRPVGIRSSDGQLHLVKGMDTFFQALDSYLKTNRAHLKDVFAKHDENSDGALDRGEVHKLVHEILPSANQDAVRSFQAALDVDGDGSVTFAELISCIKEHVESQEVATQPTNPQLLGVLRRLQKIVQEKGDVARSLFEQLDTAKSGMLELKQVAKLMCRLDPSLGPRELRLVVLRLLDMDLGRKGCVAFTDLLRALAVVSFQTRRASAREGGEQKQWALSELDYQGAVYLVDPADGGVYVPPSRARGVPTLVGRRDAASGAVSLHSVASTFVTALDRCLQENQAQLKDAFEEMDALGSGQLNLAQLGGWIRAIVPETTPGAISGFQAMLDLEEVGAVTLDELLFASKEYCAAHSDAGNPSNGELSELLSKLKTRMRVTPASVQSVFQRLDLHRAGHLEAFELMRLVKLICPELAPREHRLLLARILQMDLDGNGRLSLDQLMKAFDLIPRCVGGLHATRPAHAPRTHNYDMRARHEDIEVLEEQVQALRQKLSDVPRLRRELADTKAALAEMEEALSWDTHRVADKYIMGGGAAGGAPAEFAGELKTAWERVTLLQKKYADMQAAHAALKGQHTRAVQQLEETHARLNEERKVNLKLSAEQRRLMLELDAKSQLEPMLEKANQERYALEKDFHELTAKAMHAPAANVAESKALRLQLADAQRARSGAELRELDARRELDKLLGAAATGDALLLRKERDAARAESERLGVELDTLREKLLVHEKIKSPPAMQSESASMHVSEVRAESSASLAGLGLHVAASAVDEGLGREELLLELNNARERKAATLEELRKVQKMLHLQEAQNEDLRQEIEEVRARARAAEGELRKKLNMHERELDRRAEKLRKLEAQLKRMLTGDARAVRSSTDRTHIPGRDSVQFEGELEEGEAVFEVTLAGATLEGQVLGEEEPSTFLTMDFFEHETQATPVVAGLTPSYDMKVQYVVKVDSFFLDYMCTHTLRIELNRATGVDFQTLGLAAVPLRKAVEDLEAGTASGREAMSHFADVLGVGGQLLGTIRFRLKLSTAVLAPLRAFRQLTQPPPRLALGAEDPAVASAAAAEHALHSASVVKFTVKCCTGLRPRVGGDNTVVPYVSYQFPGFPVHDTHFARGIEPVFDDCCDFPLARTTALEQRLSKTRLEVSVFDDADVDMEEAGLIGLAQISLAPLADGVPLEGAFPLFNRHREVTGHVVISAAWWSPIAPALPPATSQAAAETSSSRSKQAMHRLRASGSRVTVDPHQETEPGEVLEPIACLEKPPANHMAMSGEMLHEACRPPPMGVSREALAAPAELEMRVTLPTASGSGPSGHGRARYQGQDESMDEEKFRYLQLRNQGVRNSLALPAGLPKDWPDPETHVIINISRVQLDSETLHNPSIHGVFMLYEFLPEFALDADMRTESLPKKDKTLTFNFTRAFAVDAADNSKARFHLSQALRGVAHRESLSIPLVLVSEQEHGDEDFLEVACNDELSLLSILDEQRDWIDREVDLVDGDGHIAGSLTLTVIALSAMQSILSDP